MDSRSRTLVLNACRLALKPVVRLLLRCGITWKEFADLGKTVFVEVATAEFGIRGRPTNMSRVAILTGINRAEVARQRALLEQDAPMVATYSSAATRVLSGWHQDAGYMEGGEPVELPIQGAAPSFEDLCRRYGGTVPLTALLKELRSVGAVGDGTAGLLRALQRTYIPQALDPEKALIGGTLIGDLGNTVVYDLVAPAGTPLRFARRATNPLVPATEADAFREFVNVEAQRFLETVDDWLTAHEMDEARARAQGVTLVRLGAGAYQVQDPVAKARA